MPKLHFGDIEIIHIKAGRFRLDGGAMFGVVPKPLWETQAPADALNRIEMACNCLLIRARDEFTLIDTGPGDRFSAKEQEFFDFDPHARLATSLKAVGYSPEQITRVVLTHLHFDHAGGTLCQTAKGIKPAFPRASYVVQQGEWDDAILGHSTMRSSYRPDDLKILQDSGQLHFIRGDVELESGISTFVTGGHTEHHQGILIRAGSHTLAYPADLIPTRPHLRPYWNMAYDMFPYQTLKRKIEFMRQASEQNWIVAWDHDPGKLWSKLHFDNGNFIAADLDAGEIF